MESLQQRAEQSQRMGLTRFTPSQPSEPQRSQSHLHPLFHLRISSWRAEVLAASAEEAAEVLAEFLQEQQISQQVLTQSQLAQVVRTHLMTHKAVTVALLQLAARS
jgi:hypothetical protein